MARYALDVVFYVVAGSDPRKPHMAPEAERHRMAGEVLRLFHPLFEYSPISRGSSAPGEESLFRLLGLNPRQRIHAFYIAGGDHYHRFNPQTGDPDTVGLIEEGIGRRLHGYDPRRHAISAVFLQRGERPEEIPTSLRIEWIGRLPARTSSTSIRDALRGRCAMKTLSGLPFTALDFIRADRLYCPGLKAASGAPRVPRAGNGRAWARNAGQCARFVRSLRKHPAFTA